ncbi:probable palmitoyltransferase ZDHHC24 [Daphnia carinata]|uniref:probable palmitoyltransferase ZDHHC24 n=1 Tax=Daphnia carinata TaxID=120202 RepID=UPI00257DE2B8|nr:probable palmitoyltransferase ZDHHC24 [Daphnia carinata]
MLRFRDRVLPKILSELVALGFVFFIIPAIYIFELAVVLPAVYDGKKEFDKFWFYFHSACGTYVMFNVVGNLIGVILVDTSAKHLIVDTKMASSSAGWHFCSFCETLSPPRSWHCSQCNTCILKREHHCGFTGCCIGYNNFRFFYLFLAYLFRATIYATYFNHYFIWSQVIEFEWSHIIRIAMPLTILFFGIDTSMTQLYFFYYSITMIGCCFSGVLLYQQSNLAFFNQTSWERDKGTNDHDCGVMHNIRDALGRRWHLIWLCPFLQSPLPHKGIKWMTRDQVPLEGTKNK